MTIEFYTSHAVGLRFRRWTCRKCDFEAAVKAAREFGYETAAFAMVRLRVTEPFRGTHELLVESGELVAYADGGNPPIGELWP